LLNVKFICQN